MDSPTKRTLPHAMVIGTPKSGTTTLCGALMRHPGVYMYPKKETHFFNDLFQARDMAWYEALFAPAPEGALLMEGTPDYAMSHCVDKTAARIATYIPDVKLILMVRNPIDRIESHYVQMLSNAREIVPIDEALVKWPEIVGTSDYSATLDTLTEYFPKQNILVLFLDDYKTDKRAAHAQVLDFLGLDGTDQAALDAMDAQQTLHTRENQGMDGALLARVRRWKYYDRLNMLLPRGLIAMGKKLLRKPIKVPSALPAETRARLEEELGPKWTRFQKDYRRAVAPPSTAQ